MTGLFFSLAIAAALVAVAVHRLRRWGRWRASASMPGHRREAPVVVTRFDEIDAFVRGDTCPCGGRLEVVSEGLVADSGPRLRVVVGECTRCENRVRMYFDLRRLEH